MPPVSRTAARLAALECKVQARWETARKIRSGVALDFNANSPEAVRALRAWRADDCPGMQDFLNLGIEAAVFLHMEEDNLCPAAKWFFLTYGDALLRGLEWEKACAGGTADERVPSPRQHSQALWQRPSVPAVPSPMADMPAIDSDPVEAMPAPEIRLPLLQPAQPAAFHAIGAINGPQADGDDLRADWRALRDYTRQ